MKTIVFFLEGPSEKEMLLGLLPKILPADMDVRYLVFRGKQDLEKNLVRRLRGWQVPDSVFVVMRDQDAGDCHHIKAGLEDLCRERSIRLACPYRLPGNGKFFSWGSCCRGAGTRAE